MIIPILRVEVHGGEIVVAASDADYIVTNHKRVLFSKTANRQLGRARSLAIDTAHDAEGTMRDNLGASLIIAVGLGVVIGYMIGRSSD